METKMKTIRVEDLIKKLNIAVQTASNSRGHIITTSLSEEPEQEHKKQVLIPITFLHDISEFLYAFHNIQFGNQLVLTHKELKIECPFPQYQVIVNL